MNSFVLRVPRASYKLRRTKAGSLNTGPSVWQQSSITVQSNPSPTNPRFQARRCLLVCTCDTDRKSSTKKEDEAVEFRVTEESSQNSKTQLTHFEDATTVVTEVDAPLDIISLESLVNSLPPTGLSSVLSRMYQLETFSWSDSQASFALLSEYSFPQALFDQTYIKDQIQYFAYFRCSGIKIQIRLNSTAKHYGMLIMSYLPAYLPGVRTTQNSSIARRNNRPFIISAVESSVVEFVIPWSIPYPMISLPLSSTDSSLIAHAWIDVLMPLRAVASTVSDVDVTVYASFVEPELIGPNPTIVTPTSSSKKVKKSPPPEIKDKSDNHSMFSSFEDSVSGIMSMVSSVSDIASTVAPFLSMLDKPTLADAPQKFRPSYGNTLITADGADDVQTMSLYQDSRVATEGEVVGPEGAQVKVHDVVSNPGFFIEIDIDSNTPVGTRLACWRVDPTLCYGELAAYPGAPAPNTFEKTHTYLSWYSNLAKYWRGSIKYSFYIGSSQFTSCRVKFSFLPGYYAPLTNDGANWPNTVGFSGDVLSHVVDVQGDTVVNFEIPYLKDRYWCLTRPQWEGFDGSPGLFTTGVVLVELVNQMSVADATDPTQHVTMYGWTSAGHDFQLAGLMPRSNFNLGSLSVSVDVTPTSSVDEITRKNVLRFDVGDTPITAKNFMADQFVSVNDLCKRYSPLPNVDRFSNPPAYIENPIDIQAHLLTWCLAPFRFFRGGVRYRVQYSGGGADSVNKRAYIFDSSTPNPVGTNLRSDYGDYLGGVIEESGSNAALLALEIPFYHSVGWYLRENYQAITGNPAVKLVDPTIAQLEEPTTRAFMSAADDFTMRGLFSPPTVKYNHVDA